MLASLVNENVIDTGFLARDYQKQSKAIISNRHCDAHDSGEAVSTASPAIKKFAAPAAYERRFSVRPPFEVSKKTRKKLHSGEGQTCGKSRVTGNSVVSWAYRRVSPS